MKIIPKAVACIIMIFASVSLLQGDVYKVQNLFNAYFPSKPEYLGQMGNGTNSTIAYRCVNETSLLSYTLLFTPNRRKIPENEIFVNLAAYAKGSILGVQDGSISPIKQHYIKSIPSVLYTSSYSSSGVRINKFAVTSFVDGRYVTWSVQEYVGASTQDAKTSFEKHLKSFLFGYGNQ
jgi:hypothetical protein